MGIRTYLTTLTAAAICMASAATADAAGIRAQGNALRGQVKQRDHVRIIIDSLEVAKTSPDGTAWDDDGSAPDVVVKVSVGGKTVEHGPFESFTPSPGIGPIRAPIGSTFSIQVYDRDASGDVLISNVNWKDGKRTGFQILKGRSLPQLVITSAHVSAWTLPEVAVVAEFPLDEATRTNVATGLRAFNQRLLTATGGQIRVSRFVVYSTPWPAHVTKTTPGIHLTRGTRPHGCPKVQGSPSQPTTVKVNIPKSAQDTSAFARRALHAFTHGYLGGRSRAKPRAASHRHCFVAAKGSATGCVAGARSLLNKQLGLVLLPPPKTTPTSPPAPPRIDFESDDQVAAGDDDGGPALDDTTINRVLSGHGAALGRCLRTSITTTAKIRFSIRGADGKVGWVLVNGNGTGRLQRCVRNALSRARFPTFAAPRTVAQFEMSR